MNISGVSLLASRLKSHAPRKDTVKGDAGQGSTAAPLWASHESVKLTDSVSGDAPAFAEAPVEYLRANLESIIRQTNAQEQALLRYQQELIRQTDMIDRLEIYIWRKNLEKQKYRIFHYWRKSSSGKPNCDALSTPSGKRISTPGVTESVNLNDTLRNLAMSLQSPLNDHASSLTLSSTSTISAPFKTVRKHKLAGN